MMKKIYYLSSSIVCAAFLFGATSANAALDCATVCQGDICGFSERLAKACIAECGKDPTIKVCRAAARKAFSQSRRQKQEAAGEEIRKQRAAKRQNINQSEEQEENVDTGSSFNDNEVSNIPPIDETSNEPIIKADETIEDQGSSEPPAPKHQMRPHHRPNSSEQSHEKIDTTNLGGDVCRAPAASITKAISLLQNVQNCGGAGHEAPVLLADGEPGLEAPALNAGNIPDAPTLPPAGRHQATRGGSGNITSDALEAGRKRLRPASERRQVNNNEMTRQLDGARKGLRPVAQHPRPSHEVNNNEMTKQLDGAKKGLRPVGERQRPSYEVNNDEMTKQLKAAKEGLRPASERQLARRGVTHNAAAKKAEQGTFHNSEGGNNFLNKLGQNVAGKVLKNVGVGGGG